jgi:hypothetical protein
MLAQGNMKSDRNSEQETDPLHSLEQRWPAVKLKEPTINYSLCYYGISILHSQSTPTVTEPQRVRCDWNHSYASFFHVQAVVVVCDACAISRGGRVSSSARTAQTQWCQAALAPGSSAPGRTGAGTRRTPVSTSTPCRLPSPAPPPS